MRLFIENIAQLEQASIQIEGVSVLAGYNATGKSTVSKSLNAILNAYAGLQKKVERSRTESVWSALWDLMSNVLPEEDTVDWALRYLQPLTEAVAKGTFPLPENYSSFRVEASNFYSDHKPGFLPGSSETEELYASFRKKAAQAISRPDSAYAEFLVGRDVLSVFDKQINTIGRDTLGRITLAEDNGAIMCDVALQNNKLLTCTDKAIPDIQTFYIEPKHMLDELQSGNRPLAYSRTHRSRLINNLAVHAQDPAEQMGGTFEEYERIEHILELIDEATHGGLVESEGSLQYVDKRWPAPISMRNVASGSKTFAAIRRLVESRQFKKNSVLIIDEPEVNLHPAWQLILAEVLVILSKELDVKILLNSHSPYFVRAVEVKSNEQDFSEQCHFYLTVDGTDGTYRVKDVTEQTEEIYRALYLPFEKL